MSFHNAEPAPIMAENRFDLEDGFLNVGRAGSHGPDILLLHGLGSIWQDWESVMRPLSKDYRLHAPDFRGCGHSSRLIQAYRLGAYVADMVSYIGETIGHPVVVVGHSLGAMTAICMAVAAPQWIQALALEDPPAYLIDSLRDWEAYPSFALMRELALSGISQERMAAIYGERLNYDLAESVKMARSTALIDPEIIDQILAGQFWQGFDADRLLPKISCPVLLMHGQWALGSALRPEDIERCAALLPDARFCRISGAGHGLHTAAAPRFNDELAEFLTTVVH